MTKVIRLPDGGRVVIIEEEPEAVCEECGKLAEEVRPYGENFKKICWECGMKNPELTKRMMDYVLFGEVPEGKGKTL